jgi:glutathione synthase/RimK-type ligase-like ATP-grasp enzyme
LILLCGIPSERPLAMVERELEALGTPFLWFNQRHFDQMSMRLEVGHQGVGGALRVGAFTVPLPEIRGVYTRLMDDRFLPDLAGESPASPRRKRCRALHVTMLHWTEITPARVVNRGQAMASNSSKPYQAQLIREFGFLVPDTLITNDPALVEEFRARHGRVIYKSASGIRSIVRLLTDDDGKRLDSIRWCPTQFQQFIDGTNVRVHVIGTEVFATTCASDAVDYRYAARDGGQSHLQPATIADDTAARCIALVQSLGLEFGGVDLKITPEGAIYCFEVNPSPGFSYFEASTGQPIARAVARHLSDRS